ncbi:pentapeptide repeat-containing protein [Micromonospora sp. MSM11]|nr:pentapeptide repeat-containing protein [Micromonospora sp. MSM11]MCL7455562.1 pentapeptide repeat-containing protein [Micromonospora sp. MSM11]
MLFVAVGLYITNDANREQQRLTAQGQITDRFTKAVEQLGQSGPGKVDVRLGAIYALERIMRDSAEDQPAVVDVLAAFVRVHAPAPLRATPTPASTSATAATPTRPPVDIQAALTVLFRRDATRSSPGTVDLTDTSLVGADLYGANLSGTVMNGADLRNANLIKANMSHVDLNYANLRDASTYEIDLSGTWMIGTDLRGTFLFSADLSEAVLRDADLRGAFLINTDLAGTDLTGAKMDDANPPGPLAPRCAHTDKRTQLPEGVARPIPCPASR